MVHGWGKAEELSNRVSEMGSIYVRLANDGDKVVGVFCGEPFARSVHWTGASYDECTGDSCELCATGKKAVLRVACNFYVLTDGSMKIIEGGNRWFSDVLKVRKKYGLTDWAFEVERQGAANSTRTKYAILPDVRLDAQQRRSIASCQLHDLAENAATAADAAYAEPASVAQQASVPVDMQTAKELHAQLKGLDKADVAAFFEQFKVTRVSQLAAADVPEARAFLAERDDLPF